ncbi:MAG: iron ABC transporter substrate-binding protein, partial [Desulfomonilaceae bacterium]
QRIIALSSGTLRLITYLQATDKVVGIEDFEKARPFARPYIMAHPELTKLPRIGPGGPGSINKEPDMEAVLQIKPDVIFISYMEAANADALQKKLGIPVVVLSHGRFASFDELVYESLKVAGKILGKEQRAQEVIQFIEQRRNELSSLVKDVPDEQKPEVYVGAIGYKGVQGIESTDASYTPLEWIRAKNMAKRIASGQHLFIDKEKLLQLNPPIIFIDGGGLQLVKQDYEKKPEFYKGLKAFQEHKVYVLYPFNYYVTNVDTAIVDAYAAGRILYPERFAGVDVAKKADEIYTFLVGKPVYKDMEKDFGPIGAEAMFVK